MRNGGRRAQNWSDLEPENKGRSERFGLLPRTGVSALNKLNWAKSGDYLPVISTWARVFSHSMRRVHLPSAWSKAMVKFSTGAEVLETVIGMRASSSLSYL